MAQLRQLTKVIVCKKCLKVAPRKAPNQKFCEDCSPHTRYSGRG